MVKSSVPRHIKESLDSIEAFIEVEATRSSQDRTPAMVQLGRALVRLLTKTYLAGVPVFDRSGDITTGDEEPGEQHDVNKSQRT